MCDVRIIIHYRDIGYQPQGGGERGRGSREKIKTLWTIESECFGDNNENKLPAETHQTGRRFNEQSGCRSEIQGTWETTGLDLDVVLRFRLKNRKVVNKGNSNHGSPPAPFLGLLRPTADERKPSQQQQQHPHSILTHVGEAHRADYLLECNARHCGRAQLEREPPPSLQSAAKERGR